MMNQDKNHKETNIFHDCLINNCPILRGYNRYNVKTS